VTSRRFAFIAAAVGALVLAGAAAFAACGSESSDRSERRRAAASTTSAPATTVTTVAPQTIPVPPLPPAGPTTAPPPAISVPRGTVNTAPASTTPPTVTAAPASTTPPTVTNAPATTATSPTTTNPTTSTTKPNKVTRKTVVFTPPREPKRGDLVLPSQHQDTFIVLVHGGDGSTGSRKQMRGWADFYAAHGYASLAIDYVLAKPSTPSPVYPKPENNVKTAVQYARKNAGQLGISADRIVVQGFGAGAALSAQALVTPDDAFFDSTFNRYLGVSDTPAAFIGFSGVYDGTQRNPTRYYGGPPDSSDPQVKDRYAKADSIAQVSSAAGPALLYVDENGDAPANQSATSFRDALQSVGKDVTLTVAPGAGGGFDEQAAQQVLEWLEARSPAS
jgi:acetyl esterase/lipase